MSLHIIILAAGLGKRMHSAKPKVLHELGGKPLLAHVIITALSLNPEAVHVIYGHGGEQIIDTISKFLPSCPVNWINQLEQLGTGNAVMQALPHLPGDATVLILYGDVPLIEASTLSDLVACVEQSHALTLLLAHPEDPSGLGRIVRNQQGIIQAIVEEKDASDVERQLSETYTGICCVEGSDLARWLPKLTQCNAQGEYYLTEIIQMAIHDHQTIQSIETTALYEIQGVNDRLQLHQLERVWQQQQAEKWLLAGVTIADSTRFDLRGELHCDPDVFIDVNCVFIGTVSLAEGCHIEPNCMLTNVTVGKDR